MKNNAAMCQLPITEEPSALNDPVGKVGPLAQPVPDDAAAPGAPVRTVLGELHRMFALIAIR